MAIAATFAIEPTIAVFGRPSASVQLCWRRFENSSKIGGLNLSWQMKLKTRAQAGSETGAAATVATFAEAQELARCRGLSLALRTLGPAYRIICREEGSGRILSVTSGFVVPPLRLMHCDMLQVFKGGEGGRSLHGLGLLMGVAVFAHGLSCGCEKAEILAINDDDAWHERLVRYYSWFGFRPVRAVTGDSLADLPHMLVWGGAGTRMDADVPQLLQRWSAVLRAAERTAGG